MRHYIPHLRRIATALWVCAVLGVGITYLTHPDALQSILQAILSVHPALLYVSYLAIASVLSLFFLPSTVLIALGLFLFPPLPLFLLTVAGIVTSSTVAYRFAHFMQLHGYFSDERQERMMQIEQQLRRHQVPIIALWSFSPITPTDIIIYVAATLRIPLRRVLTGVMLGEVPICAIYIFGGHRLLGWLQQVL